MTGLSYQEMLREELAKSEITCPVFICRRDGVLVCAGQSDERNESSYGALIGGIWQAAYSLMQINHEFSEDLFRLSFDTSDSGVYILPLMPKSGDFLFLACLYREELNPGHLKSKLRGLKTSLEDVEWKEREEEIEEALFENITDEEIDKMFSSAGI